MGLFEVKAADVSPPVEGSVFVVVTDTTSVAVSVAAFKGDWITLQADGADVYIVFGDSEVVAEALATSGDTRSARIPAGQDREFSLEKNTSYTHMAYVSTETGLLRYWKS
jgi:hypothetical protein